MFEKIDYKHLVIKIVAKLIVSIIYGKNIERSE